eukprot:365503-Chlamydomonas_euryale.AAC.1
MHGKAMPLPLTKPSRAAEAFGGEAMPLPVAAPRSTCDAYGDQPRQAWLAPSFSGPRVAQRT